jgi:hypothetical protein
VFSNNSVDGRQIVSASRGSQRKHVYFLIGIRFYRKDEDAAASRALSLRRPPARADCLQNA